MNGVRTGTRLEQLLELRRQVDLQIEAERRTHPAARTLEVFTKPPAKRPGGTARNAAKKARLAALGVELRDLRAWAIDQGLLPAGTNKGIPTDAVIDAYEQAHRQEPAVAGMPIHLPEEL